MHKASRFTLLVAVAAVALLLSSCASGIAHHSRDLHDGHVLKVALWGDEFYADDPATKTDRIDQTIQSMNDHQLDFTLFAGDTKNGHSECTDQAIGDDVATIFNSLDIPTLYTLGDNEWTDCHRANNGAYDPLERLAYLRGYFFNKDATQGVNPIQVERQGALGEAYSENSRFVKNDVEFVALHIPGSNNNLVATEKECTKKTGRAGRIWDSINNVPLEECAAATAEYQARNDENIIWLTNSFTKARDENLAGVVIVIQADIFFPFELSDGGYQEDFLPSLDATNGYADFFNTLVDETQHFAGKILLVHGDSHYFKIDKAMYDADGRLTGNFTRVEVFGSEDNDWVEMMVDPRSENVFSFQPVVLPR
jgi:hypothetical protein